MKTILVPTDFSDNSRNAFRYSLELAKISAAKVVLFHVIQIIVSPVPDMPVVVTPSEEELEREGRQRLTAFANEARNESANGIEIEYNISIGSVTDKIFELIREKKIDLIVMGISGTNLLREMLIGSNTVKLIREASCPVLAVPPEAKFKKLQTIVFACDYKKNSNDAALDTIKEFVNLFNSKLHIINISKPAAIPTTEQVGTSVHLEHQLKEINPTVYFPEQDDVVEGINEFVEEYHADMLVMIPRRHSLLEIIFSKSNTKKMAFHTHIPLLAVHEN